MNRPRVIFTRTEGEFIDAHQPDNSGPRQLRQPEWVLGWTCGAIADSLSKFCRQRIDDFECRKFGSCIPGSYRRHYDDQHEQRGCDQEAPREGAA